MQIEIRIDSSCTEPKIIVMAASMSEDIHNLVKRLSENSPQIISGMKDDKLEVLEQSSLIRIYASAGKVLAVTDNGEYVVRSRLYELEERLDRNRIHAVILQAVLCGILGGVFGASSVVWEMENWSIVKQTGIYFLITASAMMPVAYFSHWMEHSIRGFLSYFGIFTVIFIFIWLIQYLIVRRSVKKLNSKLN